MKLKFGGSTAHLRKELHPTHGPQVWPWWKLVWLGFYRINPGSWCPGLRVWVYTRWGSMYGDVLLLQPHLRLAGEL